VVNYIESKTAEKIGWDRDSFRYVRNLTKDERKAVKDGHVVYFRFHPWHYSQSGFKVVTYRDRGFHWDYVTKRFKDPFSGEIYEEKVPVKTDRVGTIWKRGRWDSREPTADELAYLKQITEGVDLVSVASHSRKGEKELLGQTPGNKHGSSFSYS